MVGKNSNPYGAPYTLTPNPYPLHPTPKRLSPKSRILELLTSSACPRFIEDFPSEENPRSIALKADVQGLGFIVNLQKLETGLRTIRAGIPYTLLLGIEAIGFPTFGLLL